MTQSIIALDIGSKTIGLAYSSGVIASSLDTIRFEEYNFNQGLKQLDSYLKKYNPSIIVVGYPKNMNNTIGERAEMVDYVIEMFLDMYKNFNKDQIIKIDERRTTKIAKNILIQANLTREKQKKYKDSLAAQLILELYLESRKL
ncbi:Holliday junction resolvase RuvX [Mycoplasma mycoides]|uniref:Holliday junction resolvase RuvX n=1 Tax=Mycoplasma mycoides TaxID=2102 RepID=UPI00223F7DFC|nr:Holliday junction resolvase RuvX [Mycoplasma mycoides]QVK02173.1 Holliday junction resolvase RuvX [Mycoplasma mycoides subsp. capri]QVK02982.1 Holliday junction resolvase RuvX [Mycoplasma mycoides subsp. capri]QVK03799.1 Holliday junction resolvase RuvX [Mycoplasma mycoides subsp. capri]QVK05407.1 Holliday junction resolvase RuvX [Mycoplasma mycoides subsp. capri]QVK06193.1 Holliday junction resolvase RuvX [Mycoplasma mycoides subsp. capri]